MAKFLCSLIGPMSSLDMKQRQGGGGDMDELNAFKTKAKKVIEPWKTMATCKGALFMALYRLCDSGQNSLFDQGN